MFLSGVYYSSPAERFPHVIDEPTLIVAFVWCEERDAGQTARLRVSFTGPDDQAGVLGCLDRHVAATPHLPLVLPLSVDLTRWVVWRPGEYRIRVELNETVAATVPLFVLPPAAFLE